VTATDLDGNSTSQTVTCEVATAYSAWQNQYTLQGTNAMPDADPDGDRLRNAVEFALMGSPQVSDACSILPSGRCVTTNSEPYPALTFKLRKDLGGAMVLLQSSSDLTVEGWSQVWSSEDLTGPQVMQCVDQDNHWLLTVRDATPFSTGTPIRFLCLQVSLPQ